LNKETDNGGNTDGIIDNFIEVVDTLSNDGVSASSNVNTALEI
jgi:hypothetical protein